MISWQRLWLVPDAFEVNESIYDLDEKDVGVPTWGPKHLDAAAQREKMLVQRLVSRESTLVA